MISEILTFDGGLSTKTAPHLIGLNEGIICENVDLESGILKPFSSLTYVDNVNGKHIYPYQEIIISNQNKDENRFYNRYNNIIYWSDAGYTINGIMKYNGTNIGIEADAPEPLTEIQLSKIVMELNSVKTGALTESASYTYAFTVVDEDGIESTPMIKESSVDLVNHHNSSINMKMSKTDWTTYFSGIFGINIYRIGGSNPTFNLIAEGLTPSNTSIIDGDLDDDYTDGYVYYVDSVADINVSRIELATFENDKANESIDMLIENEGTFWGSVGKKIYFSQTGSPEFWNKLDYVNLDKDCTGIGKYGSYIIAFTRSSAYLIQGYSRDTISLQRLPFNQGCVNRYSIVNVGAYLVWSSLNGICLYDGSTIQVITKKTLSWDEFGRVGNYTYDDFNNSSQKWDTGIGFDIQYAVGFQDKYYGKFSDGIMVIDLANGLKVSTISTPDIASLAVNDDDNFLYVVVELSDLTFDVYSLVNNNSKMLATWKTGRQATGSVNIRKHYRQVDLDGIPTSVEVFIDGISKYISYGKSKFMLPPGLIGRDIQFEIKTTNEIRSLKYQYSTLKP